MDRIFDALVTAAAADIASHRLTNLIMAGLRVFDQQCRGLHDLPDLAKAALRNVALAPALLTRMTPGGMQPLDGRALASRHIGNRRDAGAHGLLVDHHSACAAERLSAAI